MVIKQVDNFQQKCAQKGFFTENLSIQPQFRNAENNVKRRHGKNIGNKTQQKGRYEQRDRFEPHCIIAFKQASECDEEAAFDEKTQQPVKIEYGAL